MKYINDFNIDFDKYKIKGVSHFYVLFDFGNSLRMNSNINMRSIVNKLNNFYTKLRSGDKSAVIENYRISMQSRTKSKSQREKRLKALIEYCG